MGVLCGESAALRRLRVGELEPRSVPAGARGAKRLRSPRASLAGPGDPSRSEGLLSNVSLKQTSAWELQAMIGKSTRVNRRLKRRQRARSLALGR